MSSSSFRFDPHFPELVNSLPGVKAALDAEAAAWVEMMHRRDVELEDYLAGLIGGLRTWAVGNTAGGEGSMSEEVSTTADHNTAFGFESLANNTFAGSRNTAFGSGAMRGNTTGALNTALGAEALQENTSGFSNTAVGQAALQANTLGFNNTAVGTRALPAVTTGYQNVGVGDGAGGALVTGWDNVAVGLNSGPKTQPDLDGTTSIGVASEVDGHYATAVGWSTLAHHDGGVAIGVDNTGAVAETTADNDFVLGTPLHTVRVPGTLSGYVATPAHEELAVLHHMESHAAPPSATTTAVADEALQWMAGGVAGPQGPQGSTGATGAAADESLIWMQSAVPGPVGPAGPAGSGGSGDETLVWMLGGGVGPAGARGPGIPTYVPLGVTFCVPQYEQALFTLPIVVDGIMEILGDLVEVS